MTLKDKIVNYLFITTLALFIYMPFHVFLTQWLSTYTGGLDVWKIAKDIITAAVTLVAILMVYGLKKQTKLFSWLLGGVLVYGLVHLVLLLSYDNPVDVELLASTYNLRLFAYVLLGYSLVLLLPKTKLVWKFS